MREEGGERWFNLKWPYAEKGKGGGRPNVDVLFSRLSARIFIKNFVKNITVNIMTSKGGRSICRWTRNEDFEYLMSRIWEKYGWETVFSTLDGAGNYWKK